MIIFNKVVAKYYVNALLESITNVAHPDLLSLLPTTLSHYGPKKRARLVKVGTHNLQITLTCTNRKSDPNNADNLSHSANNEHKEIFNCLVTDNQSLPL